MWDAIVQILVVATNLVVTIIVGQVILTLLIMFNIVSLSNQYVAAVHHALNALLDPVLKPIRRFMPDTGMLDFSPIVLIFGLQALMIIVQKIAQA